MRVQEAERPQIALPAAAAPSISHPRARRLPIAREAVLAWADRRAWATDWDHPIRVAIKGLLLTVIVALGSLLAGYAGVLPLLPATPPRLEVTSAALHARVTSWTYCWLRPGAGGCVDDQPATGQAPAQIAARPAQAIALRFSYPSPTACTATGAASATSGVPLTVAPDREGGLAPGYLLLAPTAPGTYDVSIVCGWNPHRALRWLRGFGNATYLLKLKVAG
jgi:hypothetical protein